MRNFEDQEIWDSVEKLYPPQGSTEPPESEIEGSSTHANVFNRRFQAVVNRTAWLKAQISKGVLSQLITIGDTAANKILYFNKAGRLVPAEFPPSFSVGDVKTTLLKIDSNPHLDGYGYYWYKADGSPLNSRTPAYEKLFKNLWANEGVTVTEGKGVNADSDWNAGKNLVIPQDITTAFTHLIFTGYRQQ